MKKIMKAGERYYSFNMPDGPELPLIETWLFRGLVEDENKGMPFYEFEQVTYDRNATGANATCIVKYKTMDDAAFCMLSLRELGERIVRHLHLMVTSQRGGQE
jgi:hypothetical protein